MTFRNKNSLGWLGALNEVNALNAPKGPSENNLSLRLVTLSEAKGLSPPRGEILRFAQNDKTATYFLTIP